MSLRIDPVRWFDPLGRCSECSKEATGILRGPGNESYGPYCRKHAEARLKAAEEARLKAAEKARAEIAKKPAP